MSHSLRSRLQGLVYKGLLEKKDLGRIVIIPKDATNGEILKTLFPNGIPSGENSDSHFIVTDFSWWNAPYKKGE